MSEVRLTFTRPDDWHLHLRDGDVLASVLPRHGAAVCARHRHAQPQTGGDNHGTGVGLP